MNLPSWFPFTVIQGNEVEGTLSQAIYITRKYKHGILIIGMEVFGREDILISDYNFSKELKFIIFTGVVFGIHTKIIKDVVSQDQFSFYLPGSPAKVFVKRPGIIICTSTPKEKIPFEIFPIDSGKGERIGFIQNGMKKFNSI